ncbi:arsenite methyltransferase [Carboxylicivirga linearis]|uniref:Arsenite methyltransferase n=1 Tax=Carboxylicivirga linearis TaxID=1628157 RepID=A0ABS5JV99_9BACT|nr:arsenite methyltransferase [Carboxylicivirga linearis]MBS2098246.1 arsenite methyltransferase [Carboxylicivirga linearis]
MKPEDLKLIVKEKYGQIANKGNNTTSCCGSTNCCGEVDYSNFADSYDELKGYNPEADLGLGCGLPTEYAGINQGDSVLDLGSGAGNDCFVARQLVGAEGKVTGIDFTDEMLEKAKANALKLNYTNVKFVKGDIEDMPLPENEYDVVVSNCVLNLVPNKEKAFSEIFRVLKDGGHFSISDVVLIGELPSELQSAAEMYAGCVSGAIQKDDYLNVVSEIGFKNIEIKKEKVIIVPDDILLKYISKEELNQFKTNGAGIFSITVVGTK